MNRMKFTIRDLLFVTVIIAILAGWWVDRSKLAWTHARTLDSAEQLRAQLDAADPGWRDRPLSSPMTMRPASATAGYVMGTALVTFCILLIVLVWKGYVHPSVLEEHRRF